MEALFLCLLVFSANEHVTSGSSLSAEKSLVWGPGLDHNIHLPVHYVYIQAVDQDGNKYVCLRVNKPISAPTH